MAKFCGNCGAKLEDSAKVCGYCGTTLADSGEAQEEVQTNEVVGSRAISNSMSSEKKKRLIKLIAIGAVALVALIVFISIITSCTGVKGAARKVMNAFVNEDADALADMVSEAVEEAQGNYLDDFCEGTIEAIYAYYELAVDGDFKLKYKIVEAYEPTNRTKKEIIETLEDDYDIDVSKVMIVKVEVTAKGKDDKETDKWKLTFTKEEGKWKLYDFEE